MKKIFILLFTIVFAVAAMPVFAQSAAPLAPKKGVLPLLLGTPKKDQRGAKPNQAQPGQDQKMPKPGQNQPGPKRQNPKQAQPGQGQRLPKGQQPQRKRVNPTEFPKDGVEVNLSKEQNNDNAPACNLSCLILRRIQASFNTPL